MRRLLLCLVMPVLLVSGCTDDQGSEGEQSDDRTQESVDEAPEDLAFDDWVDEVNQVCTDAGTELDELATPASFDDFAVIVEVGEEALEIRADALADIEELGAPDDAPDEVEAWLETWETRADLTEDVIAAAEDQDVVAVEEVVAQGQEVDAEADGLSEELGLDDCVGGE